jgi:hypothetical protein
MSPEERAIREDEQRRAHEAVRTGQHYYYGPDCIFCGAFGPTESDEPCFSPKKLIEDKLEEIAQAARERKHFWGAHACIFCGCADYEYETASLGCFTDLKELERYKSLLRSVDFYLDEFGCGACAVSPRAEPDQVPNAVANAMATLRVRLAEARKDLRMKACWADCKCEPRRLSTAEARVDVLKQAILLLKHRDVNGEPCFCFLWPDEEPHCEAQTGNDTCRQVKEALKYPNEGYPMPLLSFFADKRTIEELEKQAAVDGPVFNLGRSEGRADVAVELRKIIDPNDEQHLSLDGTLDIVRKLVNLL